MRMLKVMLLTGWLVMGAAYAAETDDSTASQSNVYTEERQNIVVDSKQPEFIIKVKSNPTTGYSWFLREYDKAIISAVSHHYVAPEKKLMGASGYEEWTFKVKPAGFAVPQQTTIRLVYARPWQGADSSSQAVFRVTTISSR